LHLKEVDIEIDRKASRHRYPVIDGRNREEVGRQEGQLDCKEGLRRGTVLHERLFTS